MEAEGEIARACDALGKAVDSGKMGEIVAKHEKMILGYYKDVHHQANKSFDVARSAAIIGFAVIIFSFAYILIFDALGRSGVKLVASPNPITVSVIGVISGALIEFIAAVAFALYARGAKQFSAFHICLERTHRYLLAFKIAQEAGAEKDKILHELVSTMANAPMISHSEIEGSK